MTIGLHMALLEFGGKSKLAERLTHKTRPDRVVRWQTKAIPDVAAIQAAFMPNIAVNTDATKAARSGPPLP